MPFLGYYRRSYSTSRDGVVTEYGDGLTTIDPQSPDETKDIVIRSISVADGEEIMSHSFSIEWTKKFTYEPAETVKTPSHTG